MPRAWPRPTARSTRHERLDEHRADRSFGLSLSDRANGHGLGRRCQPGDRHHPGWRFRLSGRGDHPRQGPGRRDSQGHRCHRRQQLRPELSHVPGQRRAVRGPRHPLSPARRQLRARAGCADHRPLQGRQGAVYSHGGRGQACAQGTATGRRPDHHPGRRGRWPYRRRTEFDPAPASAGRGQRTGNRRRWFCHRTRPGIGPGRRCQWYRHGHALFDDP
ncbi:hypothetical protein D3C77_480700 [compost metagenome]